MLVTVKNPTFKPTKRVLIWTQSSIFLIAYSIQNYFNGLKNWIQNLNTKCASLNVKFVHLNKTVVCLKVLNITFFIFNLIFFFYFLAYPEPIYSLPWKESWKHLQLRQSGTTQCLTPTIKNCYQIHPHTYMNECIYYFYIHE